MDFKRISNSTDKLDEFIAGADSQKEQSTKKGKVSVGTKFSKNTQEISNIYARKIYRISINNTYIIYKR